MLSFFRVFFLFALLLSEKLAYAYVGPGAGLSAIGSVLALIGAIFMLIIGFLWYPIKRLLKKKHQQKTDAASELSSKLDEE